MGDPKTGKLPSLGEWKAWLAMAALFVVPPATGTAVLTVKLDGLQAAVAANTGASRANTAAVQKIQVAMEERKVTSQRLQAVEGAVSDHEARLRGVRDALTSHAGTLEHTGAGLRINDMDRRVRALEAK